MKTIKSKLLLALILPTVIVAVFPIIIFIASNNHHVKNTAYRSASAIIEDTTANFDTWLEGKKNLLNSYQKLDIGFLKPFLQSRATVEAEKLFSLYYGDTDGNMYSSINTIEGYRQKGYDPRNRHWYTSAKGNPGQISISEPYHDATTDNLILTFSKTYGTKEHGVIGLDIPIDTLKEAIKKLILPVKGQAFLVYGNENRIIASNLPENLLGKTLDTVYPNLTPAAVDELSKKERAENTFVAVDLRDYGDAFLISSDLKQAPWKIITLLDKSSYYSNTYVYVFITILLTAIVVFFIIFFVGRIIHTNIVRPVHHIGKTLNDLANKETNFENKIKVSTDDEIGELARNFNHFLDNQKSLFQEINSFLRTSTEDSISSNESIASQITEQKKELDEVIDSVTEINTSIKNIHKHIEDTAEIINNVNSTSRSGLETVRESDESINALAVSIKQTSDALSAVSEHADSIFSVITTIKDIAEQTNLLALNAAIESARAGEHGRGFAVVADEVRGLSIKTSESIQIVQESIKTLQQNVNSTVALMKQSILDCDNSRSSVDVMNKTIDSIVSTVNRISESTGAILEATDHQSQMIETTNSLIDKVNSANETLIKSVKESKDKNKELRKASEELSTSMNLN